LATFLGEVTPKKLETAPKKLESVAMTAEQLASSSVAVKPSSARRLGNRIWHWRSGSGSCIGSR
jgi:hypothetical protein